eukprot:COSAG01_NODE_5968_length_3926_cov_209.840345_2_plen_211_part_00
MSATTCRCVTSTSSVGRCRGHQGRGTALRTGPEPGTAARTSAAPLLRARCRPSPLPRASHLMISACRGCRIATAHNLFVKVACPCTHSGTQLLIIYSFYYSINKCSIVPTALLETVAGTSAPFSTFWAEGEVAPMPAVAQQLRLCHWSRQAIQESEASALYTHAQVHTRAASVVAPHLCSLGGRTISPGGPPSGGGSSAAAEGCRWAPPP